MPRPDLGDPGRSLTLPAIAWVAGFGGFMAGIAILHEENVAQAGFAVLWACGFTLILDWLLGPPGTHRPDAGHLWWSTAFRIVLIVLASFEVADLVGATVAQVGLFVAAIAVQLGALACFVRVLGGRYRGRGFRPL